MGILHYPKVGRVSVKRGSRRDRNPSLEPKPPSEAGSGDEQVSGPDTVTPALEPVLGPTITHDTLPDATGASTNDDHPKKIPGQVPRAENLPTAVSTRNKGTLNRRRTSKSLKVTGNYSGDTIWKLMELKLGGKSGMAEAALASDNPKAHIFAEMILDSAFKDTTTKGLAKKAGLNYAEVAELFTGKRKLETAIVLHDRLPEVVAGAVEDSMPSYIPCSDCKGKGTTDGGTCWVCRGAGEIRKPGDKDKLSFVGQATKLIEKGAPVFNQNQQFNINNQTVQSSSFEELMRKASVDHKKVIEGEVIETGNT